MNELEQKFLIILEQHKGLDGAIPVPQMAALLGVSARVAQQIKKDLVERHHVSIGSACGSKSGWFIPQSDDEVQATISQYKKRGQESVYSYCGDTARGSDQRDLAAVGIGI
jgi:hypothetical protein